MIKQINEIHKQLLNYYDEALSEYDLSYMQSVMLKEIYLCEDSVNAKQIESITKQNKRLVSINLSKLEQLHYVERIDDEEDKRNKIIVVTDFGLSICEELLDLDAEVTTIIKEQLSDAKYSELAKLLVQLNDSLKDFL